MEGHCMIQVDVGDANDNAPEVLLASLVNPILESTPVGTVVGLFNVRDRDSGRNGEVSLDLSPDLPFQIKPSENHYSLLTSQPLDRETTSHYIIELLASDAGSPPLHAHLTIRLNISDVNDNAPYFTQQLYTAYIPENRPPGSLLCIVAASDPDTGDNAHLTYSIVGSQIQGAPASSFVYVNPEDGRVFAQRTFDYELLQMLQVMVGVRDSGSPPLHSNASLHVFVLDQNDNAPAVLHPRPGWELSVPQRLPRSAPPGSLVTKVTAVDADAGHNAWLSYSLLPQSTAPGLFLVSAHTGEQAPPNTDWRFSQAQRPGTSGSQNGDETGTWPNNQFDTEMLQAMILASASEAADGSSTLGGGAGTMGLSARYGPQFTLQHVPDYRQNVYIPGSNATLTNAAGKRDGKAPAGGNGSKKKSGKKEKK
ncbi:protocadherin gamma-C5 isoform X17 [Canis lupus baileyi]|uniref:protocadherin gamma-C5 isoform X35 n=1 Tax=Canis lupus dingo TaxID=286419 RepID=UPI0020C2367D|nr:protocadherin gamma-C5 isoform X35 [Canis lupus dingo]